MTARWYPVSPHQNSTFLFSGGGRHFFSDCHTLSGGVAGPADFVVRDGIARAGIVVVRDAIVIRYEGTMVQQTARRS